MSINVDKVIERMEFYAPEHASKSTSLKEKAVKAAVSQRINTSLWARHGKLIDGAAYLTAHLLTKRDQGDQLSDAVQGTGPAKRITEGEVTLEFATPMQNTDDGDALALGDTDYGQNYLALKKDLISSPQTSG